MSAGRGGGTECWSTARRHASRLHIRDSKVADGPRLALTPRPWADFVRYAAARG
ncbi:DUF397 domain-containing protein [Streptomyces sp. NPDC059894]|uniref:DUF397 domain-containing protein n=1 Tax=unclassified Streptomyces TaxID=2593676 RepID=UPI003655F6A9